MQCPHTSWDAVDIFTAQLSHCNLLLLTVDGFSVPIVTSKMHTAFVRRWFAPILKEAHAQRVVRGVCALQSCSCSGESA